MTESDIQYAAENAQGSSQDYQRTYIKMDLLRLLADKSDYKVGNKEFTKEFKNLCKLVGVK